MKISLNGLIHQSSKALTGPYAKAYRYSLLELLGNLSELKQRKAEGEKIIDEFFNCYDLTAGQPAEKGEPCEKQ